MKTNLGNIKCYESKIDFKWSDLSIGINLV